MKRFLAIICIIGMLLLAGNSLACGDCNYERPKEFMYAETYGIKYLMADEFDMNFTNYVLWFAEPPYFLAIMPMKGNTPSYELENWFTAGAVYVSILERY